MFLQHQVVARGFGENQCPDGVDDDTGDGGEGKYSRHSSKRTSMLNSNDVLRQI